VWLISLILLYPILKYLRSAESKSDFSKVWMAVVTILIICYCVGWTGDAFSVDPALEAVTTFLIDLVTIGLMYCLVIYWHLIEQLKRREYRGKEWIRKVAKYYVYSLILVSALTCIFAGIDDLKVIRAGFYLSIALFFFLAPCFVYHVVYHSSTEGPNESKFAAGFLGYLTISCWGASVAQLIMSVMGIKHQQEGFLDANHPENKHWSFFLGLVQGLCLIVMIYLCHRGDKLVDVSNTQPNSPFKSPNSPGPRQDFQALIGQQNSDE